MPWSNQGGGGGQGPWGRRPGGGGGGGGPQPPNFDDIIRRGQDRMRGMIPGGMGGPRGIILLILVAIAIWLATGFYRVQPDEQGVALIFGKWVDTTAPGLNYNLPAPIGTVYTPKVTQVRRMEIGFRTPPGTTQASAGRAVPQESLMLTGDENIIDIQFAVFWKIDTRLHEVKINGKTEKVQDGIPKFLFNIRHPRQTVKDAAEAAMREVIGKTDFDYARTEGRARVANETQKLMQRILDEYGAGIEVTNVQLQKVDPPGNVLDAFRDVQAARADRERMVNEANAYRNEVVQQAEGNFERIVRAAEAYKQEQIDAAEGETSRFLAVLKEYKQQPEVTTRRIYLHTMRGIMKDMNKVLIDKGAGGTGVVPYLSLDELLRHRGTPAASAGSGENGSAAATKQQPSGSSSGGQKK